MRTLDADTYFCRQSVRFKESESEIGDLSEGLPENSAENLTCLDADSTKRSIRYLSSTFNENSVKSSSEKMTESPLHNYPISIRSSIRNSIGMEFIPVSAVDF